MNDRLVFCRTTAAASLLSTALAVGCLATGFLAAGGHYEVFDDPGAFVGIGAAAAPLVYWSMIFDLFGYYLLLVPGLVLVTDWVSSSAPLASRLLFWSGSGYVLIGSVGAAILAVVWPPLIQGFEHRPAERPQIEMLFRFAADAVYGGLWNRLEVTLGAVFWVGIGVLLRQQRPAFATFSIVLGGACVVDAAGNLFHVPSVASVGLNVYLLAAPLWAAWLSVLALRGARTPAT